MNRRSKQFWIPAALSLGGSTGLLMALQRFLAPMQAPWKHAGVPVLPYLLWIIALPFLGGLAGYVSARAGSTAKSRLVAVLFPSLFMLAVWLCILVFGARRPLQWSSFLFGLTLWAIIPAACLAIGNRLISTQKTLWNWSHQTRLQRFWLPALASVCLSLGILAGSSVLGQSSYFLKHGWSNQAVYLPWLVLSPLCGAAGAYLSRRAGGPRWLRLVAGLFPGIAMLALGVALTLSGKMVFAAPHARTVLRACMASVVVPSLALLLGTMPFLRNGITEVPKTSPSALQ